MLKSRSFEIARKWLSSEQYCLFDGVVWKSHSVRFRPLRCWKVDGELAGALERFDMEIGGGEACFRRSMRRCGIREKYLIPHRGFYLDMERDILF